MFRKKIWRESVCTFLLLILAGMLYGVGTAQAAEAKTAAETTADEISTEQKIKLGAPRITYLGATAKGVMKLEWKRVPQAEHYVIYRATSKKGVFKEIGTSRKNRFSDKKGKGGKRYYYKVVAAVQDKQTGAWIKGERSAAKMGKVRKSAKRIAFVGDSIMTGFSNYNIVGKGTKVFAKIGLNATTFYNTALMRQMMDYKADRIVLMFGMNGLGSLERWSVENQIECISKIIKKCSKVNPNVEIIILGVSPVSADASIKQTNINVFNKKLKKSLTRYENVRYYDLAQVLADPNGHLKSSYDGGDGIHWSPAAYKAAYRAISQYVKEWEQ